jgi:phosphatidylcholine synthase
MPAPDHPPHTSSAFPISAFAVHVFTATGAALALLAMMAAVEQRWTAMFLWLGVALIVDGVDGALARHFRVAARLPRWSGDTLDLVVDILTYVFVPAYALVVAGVFPDALAIPLAMLILITGVLYFADQSMKSADNYFMGFPAVWNVVAFYLLLLRPTPWIGTLVVLLLAAATFAPIPFVHPFRVQHGRVLAALMIVLWAALAAFAVVRDLAPPAWVSAVLCGIAIYFLAAGFFRRTIPKA